MNAIMSVCGLPCDTCPIHLATLEPDEGERLRLREELAREIAEHYGQHLALEAVTDCDGCLVGGRLYSGCSRCRIRPCAAGRGLESCAFCPDYACDLLQQHFVADRTAQARLEQLRCDAGLS